jgi:hypothetical protein
VTARRDGYDSPVIRRPVSLGVTAFLLLLAGCSTPSVDSPAPAAPTPSMPDPTAAEQIKAEPLTAQRLQTLWWSWASSATPSPLEDADGQLCADSQPFGVWLVAGAKTGTADRHCQVPSTLPIAGPAVTQVFPDEGACARFLADAKGEALLDNQPQKLEKIDPMKIQYDTDKGQKEGFGCGLWVRINPLPPGEHTLTLRGNTGAQATTEANYDLTVVKLPTT